MGDKTKGLYGKFIVQRADGSDQHGGKHNGCEYFVLDLSHDKHAYMALRAYANSCREEYPLLAADLSEKSKAMRAAGLFPTFSPELREAVQKALAVGKSYAEHHGAIVFINDGKTEDRWAEHEENSCPACGGSGHKDDAAPFVQRSEMLLRAMQAISKMTGDAGFNIGGPIEYCDAANDPEAVKELLIAATEYLKGISKLSGEAIARAQYSSPTAVPATANFPHDDMGAVTHRSRMTGDGKEVQWRHADKDFDDAGEVGAKAKRKSKGAADQTDATKAPEISADELRAEIQRQKGIAQEFIDKANRLEQKFSEAVEEVTRLDRELAAAKAKAVPEKKSSKPRKPFSVTGLAGFHAGGDRVTLFLDRRLHAKSITLPADKLHQLTEMARAA